MTDEDWVIPTRDGKDNLLTKAQVMQHLNVSETTYNRLIRNGTLKHFKHNGCLYMRESWLVDYWDSLADKAEADREAYARGQRQPRKKQKGSSSSSS